MKILPRSFYDRDVPLVAYDLIGKILIRKRDGFLFAGMIVETEAYRSDDPACHGYNGRTERNSPLFGPVGHTYVYMCYGIHNCLNVVSRDTKNFPAGGVLIRALIPLDSMQVDSTQSFINGPGNVAKALAIDRSHKDIDVTNPDSDIIIAEGKLPESYQIVKTGRIGISVGQDILWRFVADKLQKRA